MTLSHTFELIPSEMNRLFPGHEGLVDELFYLLRADEVTVQIEFDYQLPERGDRDQPAAPEQITIININVNETPFSDTWADDVAEQLLMFAAENWRPEAEKENV